MRRGAVYGPLIIGYLFLGGAAAGGFFAMSAWSIAFPRTARIRRSAAGSPLLATRTFEAFASLQARVYALCFILLALAIVFLFWDLGAPERVLYILSRPHATTLTFGMACLSAQALVGVLLVAASAFRVRVLLGSVKRTLQIVCCATSLATMAYTGLFLMGNIGISLWSTWTIVPLFVLSSLSCGITLMLLVDYFIKDQTLLLSAARPLQKCHLACLAAEAVFIALFVNAALSNPLAANAREILLSPDMLSTATVGVVGLGIVVPALCESFALAQQECRTIPVADVLCLVGGFLLRACVIVCGVH